MAGASARSRQALELVVAHCERNLKDNYVLEVIDIYQEPMLTRRNQIVATPTLIKESPPPVRRFIGGLRDLSGLGGQAPLPVVADVHP